jgi:hypothetical protein
MWWEDWRFTSNLSDVTLQGSMAIEVAIEPEAVPKHIAFPHASDLSRTKLRQTREEWALCKGREPQAGVMRYRP